MKKRMELCNKLWDAGLNAEHSYKPNPKMLDQFQHAEEHAIPIILVIGNDELASKTVKLRETASREEKVSFSNFCLFFNLIMNF